jgi:hypothetical protein
LIKAKTSRSNASAEVAVDELPTSFAIRERVEPSKGIVSRALDDKSKWIARV